MAEYIEYQEKFKKAVESVEEDKKLAEEKTDTIFAMMKIEVEIEIEEMEEINEMADHDDVNDETVFIPAVIPTKILNNNEEVTNNSTF